MSHSINLGCSFARSTIFIANLEEVCLQYFNSYICVCSYRFPDLMKLPYFFFGISDQNVNNTFCFGKRCANKCVPFIFSSLQSNTLLDIYTTIFFLIRQYLE